MDAGLGIDGKKQVFLDVSHLDTKTQNKLKAILDIYPKFTGEDPRTTPMKIFPAVHYTMGGLWVDYNLMSNIPCLHVIGEANFSDHGANRLGASALMQGLADGYFVLPYTISNYLASQTPGVDVEGAAFKEAKEQVEARTNRLLNTQRERRIAIQWGRCQE